MLSHWFLDYVVHRPDLPLWPNGPRAGLGLWNHRGISIVVEVLTFLAGLAVYLRTTHPMDKIGRYALAALVALLMLGYVSSLFAGPPPSVSALAWGGVGMWLLVPWGWWADSHRKCTASSEASVIEPTTG